jgi:hypothetical protein
MSLKLPKPEVSKSLIVIDREGGHVSIDHELREKSLQAKASVEELKLPKFESLKFRSKRIDVLGLDDVIWGDMDLSTCTTCHRLIW